MAYTGMLRRPTRMGMRGMGDCAWVNGSWVNVLANGSVEGCGVPPSVPIVPGTDPATSIENFYQQVIASDPYYSSPAYLAAEAAAGAPDPGVTQDAINTLKSYCQQNVFDNGIWGTPLDTKTCNGITPLPGPLSQVSSIVTPNYYSIAPASPTSPGVVTAVPPKPPTNPVPLATNPPATTVQNSTTNAGNNASTDLVSKLPAWFTDPTQDVVPGVENLFLLGGVAVAALIFIPMLTKGR